MNDNALIIIAKYPEEENVKTRLKGLIPDKKRLEIYISLLELTLCKLKSIPGVDTYIAYTPESGKPYFEQFGVGLIPLPETDLGTGMFHAFRELFKKGYQRAVLVGADIPDLSSAVIRQAFELLSSSDIVYGPAKDGGYYLVAMKKLIKDVFEDVPWSSDQTLNKSLEKAERCGYSVAFTELLSDIDTIEDLRGAGLMPQIAEHRLGNRH